MKLLSSVIVFLLAGALLIGTFTTGMQAQEMTGVTQFATILPNVHGQIMQYAFPISPFSEWDQYRHARKFSFAGSNLAEVQTVNGVTELYLLDTHDFCGPKAGPNGYCGYVGTLDGQLKVEAIGVPGSASYQHVTGVFLGEFIDAQGKLHKNILALLSFDTFPATDGIVWASHGGVTVVLACN